MNRRLADAIISGDLHRMKAEIRESPKLTPEFRELTEKAQLVPNLVELACEMVGQGARAMILTGGWEGMRIGSELMEKLVKVHELPERGILTQYTYALLLVMESLFAKDTSPDGTSDTVR